MRIVAAAIVQNGLTFSVPRPGRHGDVIRRMDELGFDTLDVMPSDQGFLTSEGLFVERHEAARIATEAGQFEQGSRANPQLYTEDLW